VLPPTNRDCCRRQQNRNQFDHELSNYFFALDLSPENWKSDTISTPAGRPPPSKPLRECVDLIHRGRPICLSTHTLSVRPFSSSSNAAVAKG